MEETNITMYEGVEEKPEMTELSSEVTEKFSIGTGMAMLIGSGITLAVIAGSKKLKKLWAKYKDQKEKTEDHIEAEVVKVTDNEESN